MFNQLRKSLRADFRTFIVAFLCYQGWVECVGCADRSAYDLTQHSKATGISLIAEKQLPEPVTFDVVECVPNRSVIGKTFKADGKKVLDHLAALSETEALGVGSDLDKSGYGSCHTNLRKSLVVNEPIFRNSVLKIGETDFTITTDMVEVKKYQKTKHGNE